jgi:hypothetical protein
MIVSDLREADEREAPLAEISGPIERFLTRGVVFNHVDSDRHPVLDRWRQARSALRRDPDAALPM